MSQLDIDSDIDLVNTASVTTNELPDPASAQAVTNINANPQMRVDKSVNLATVTTAGTPLTYTIAVENIGNVDLQDLTISDTLPDGSVVTIPPDTPPDAGDDGNGLLGPGEIWEFTLTHVVTQDEIDSAALSGTHALTNSVTVDALTIPGAAVGPVSDSVTTTVLAEPAVTLRKVVDVGTAPAPGMLNYTITLANTGGVRITGVALEDTLHRAAEDVSLTLSGPTGDAVPTGTLDLNEVWTYTAQYALTQDDINNAVPIVNEVTVTTAQTPPQTSQAITTVNATARLFALKYPDLSAMSEPGDINYTVAVYNLGSTSLTDVALNDVLPDGQPLTVDPVPVSNFDDGPDSDGQLDPGEYWTYTFPFTVTEALFRQALASPERQIVNTATPTALAPGGATISAPPVLGITDVLAQPGIEIEKQVDEDAIAEASTLNYTITLTNAGNQDLSGISLTDVLIGGALEGPQSLTLTGPAGDDGIVGLLEVGESWTYTASYDATAADVASLNDLINSVTVTATELPDPLSASATTTMVAQPILVVEKSVDQPVITALDPLTYTITVENAGNVPQTGIALTDTLNTGLDLTPDITGPAGDVGDDDVLDPGEIWTYELTYTPTQDVIEAAPEIVNTVSVTSDQVPDAVTASATTFIAYFLALELEKSGVLIDNGDGLEGPGDTIEYSFLVTNTGNVTLSDVTPRDVGPSFDGVPGTGTLSAFSPAPLTLGPGLQASFTVTYTLTQTDFDNASGVPDGVTNTADASGTYGTSTIVSAPSAAALSLARQGDVGFIKQALVSSIRRGEVAPFAIIVENRSNAAIDPGIVTDLMPPGFMYVEGSASIDGAPVDPVVNGREITFPELTVAAGTQATIRLSLRALPNITPGTYVNLARIVDASGDPLAPEAEAEIRVEPEAVFDCSEVIGKVFNDFNRNGYQDEGEPGLAGVRLATVRGTLITTDPFGRYSIPCAALPNPEIGSNFVLKLDTRTLPSGFAMTTDNPAMARLTAGKMTEINFGASIGRQVRIDLDADAFLAGSAQAGPALVAALDQLVGLLAPEHSSLALSYTERGADRLGQQRLRELEQAIAGRWQGAGSPYELVIELQVLRE